MRPNMSEASAKQHMPSSSTQLGYKKQSQEKESAEPHYVSVLPEQLVKTDSSWVRCACTFGIRCLYISAGRRRKKQMQTHASHETQKQTFR